VAKEVARRRSPVDAVLGRPAAAVVAGFALAVGVGTLLLMLPVATTDGTSAGLVTALFTTVSAVCVTGLVVVDTATFWSEFGELAILVMIQVGGIGIMTLATLLGLLIARRVGLRMQLTAQAETKALGLGDVRRVVVRVLAVSLIIEAATAAVLVARFALFYAEPPLRAVYLGVFHAVSAFNNAGFALFTDNMIPFATDPWICLPMGLATILGGSVSRCCSRSAAGCGAGRRGGRCTCGSRWSPMRSCWWSEWRRSCSANGTTPGRSVR
jgi:trk system potassium uptake protein TrkH